MRLGINGRFYAARVTGVQRFARELSARLYAGSDVVLLLPADAQTPECPSDRVAIVRGRLRGNAWEQIELPGLARSARCSVVLNPANSAPYSGGPQVVVVHDVLPLTQPQWFASNYVRWHRHVIRGAIRRAARVITCSEWSAAEIERACLIPRERIALVTQGLEPFGSPAEPAWTDRVVNGFGLNAPFLLCVGNDRRKNSEFLFPIVAQLRRTVEPGLLLAVVESVDTRVHAAPAVTAPEYVRRIADVSDNELRALYTGATALCFPSHAEGFGRPPLEALACGTPAVVANYGPAREVLGEAACILPLNQQAWLEALTVLVSSPVAREEHLARSASVLGRYSWSDAAAQVLDACRLAMRPGVYA